MTQVADSRQAGAARQMPRGLKWTVAAVVITLITGGLLLVNARGEAILIDLYAAAAQMLCF